MSIQQKLKDELKKEGIEVVDYGLEPQWELSQGNETIGHTFHHTGASDRPITRHHNYHVNTKGWNMIGYHQQIRTDGIVEIGRPIQAVGAHSGEKGNLVTIGTAFSGNMDLTSLTDEQYNSAIILHKVLESEVIYNKSLDVYGHKNWMSTSCPGKYTDLQYIENNVKAFRKKNQLTMEINGRKTKFDLKIEEGRTFVKLDNKWVQVREFVDLIPGADIDWDGETKTVIVKIPE